jgi:hypothetical protein
MPLGILPFLAACQNQDSDIPRARAASLVLTESDVPRVGTLVEKLIDDAAMRALQVNPRVREITESASKTASGHAGGWPQTTEVLPLFHQSGSETLARMASSSTFPK